MTPNLRRVSAPGWLWEPLAGFGVTRVAVFALVAIGQVIIPFKTGPRDPSPVSLILSGLDRWDSGWYLAIVVNGYSLNPATHSGSVAFFPLYPLLVRLALPVIRDPVVAGLLVSHLCFAAALILLYRLAAKRLGDAVARRALILVLVFPFALFYSSIYTESLFLLLVVLAFTFAEEERWWLAGLMGLLCALTRLVGMAVAPALLLFYLQRRDYNWRRLDWGFFAPGLVPLGLVLYMAYLYLRFHDPLSFYTASLYGWGRHNLVIALEEGSAGWVTPASLVPGDYDLVLQLNLLLALVWLALVVPIWRRLGPAYAVFVLICTLVPLSAGLESLGRYIAVLFPAYLVLGHYLRRPLLFRLVVAGSATALGLLTALFGTGRWII
jgi:hypothetical protein